MSDLIQNVQDVCKKWESKSVPNLSRRGRRREGQYDASTHRSYGGSGSQFDSYASYSKPGERRFNKQRTRAPYFKLPKYEGLAQFKMAPTVTAENKQRPFMGTCCLKCVPMSRATITDKKIFSLSVFNVLHIPHFQSLDFNLVLNVLKKNQKPMYPDVSQNVLKSDRILNAVEKAVEVCKRRNDVSNEVSSIVKAVQFKRVKTALDSLKTSVSLICLKFSSLLIRYLLGRMFDCVLVPKGQIELLKTVSQENVPLIYLPVCRSHLDYALVSFILFMNSLKVPLIAVEDDLYIPIIGFLMRFIGVFFIRSLEKDVKNRDPIEHAVLKSYLAECLKAGHSLEFFIEGGRSRSGKPQMPKVGLLSMVVESFVEGSIDDVYISPISISYEKLIEGDFISEQLGEPKAKESFFSSLYSIWKMMHCKYGNIRLNFNQPFSLREFLQAYNKNCLPISLLSTDTPPSSSDESNSLCGDYSKTHLKSIVNKLARHIVHDSTCSTALMSTQLLAFLFITQYRKGATLQQLQNSLDNLQFELLNKKRDTGFKGESLPVIKRAVELLGKHLISSETIDMEWISSDLENNNVKVTIYKPVTKLPHVLELQYYANSVVPVFLLDSMIVNAVYALVDVEICHFRHCDSKLFVLRDKLIDKAVELNEIMQFEFISIPPCSDISISFNDILDDLIEKEYLHVAGVGIVSNRVQYTGKSHMLSFDASDDEYESPVIKEQQLKIDLTEESINHLEFLRSILSPYIESYWLAATTLLKLVDEVKEENVFIQEMQVTAQDKLYKGFLAYEESFSADTFKNSLKLFEHWHVVEHYIQDGIKIVYLSESHNSKEKINDVIARIEEFRK